MPGSVVPRRAVERLERSALPEALTEGRALAQAGAVREFRAHPGAGALHLSAEVEDAGLGETFPVTLHVEGDTIDALCPCGAPSPCAHTLAVARRWLKPSPPSPQAVSPARWKPLVERIWPYRRYRVPAPGEEIFAHRIEAVPLDNAAFGLLLRWRALRPTGRGLGRGTPVFPEALPSLPLGPLDRRVIEAAGEGWKPVGAAGRHRHAVLVAPRDLDAVMRALSEAPYVYWDDTGERAAFEPVPVVPRITAEPQGERLRLRAEWQRADGKVWHPAHPRVFAGPWPWVEDEGVLRPVFGAADGAALAAFFAEELWVAASEIPSFLGGAVPAIRSVGAVARVPLEAGQTPEGPPRPRLFLSEEGPLLVGLLRFSYGGMEIAAENPDPVLKLDGPAGEQVMLTRDLDAEFAAVAQLRALGLRPAEPGRFEATGEAALEFLRGGIGRLSDDWEIFGRDTVKRYRVRAGALSLRVRIGTGTDWLDLDAEAEVEGDPVEMERILAALARGSRYVRLGDGTHALLPEAWAERLGTLAEELGLDSGHARVPQFLAPSAEEILQQADEGEIDDPARWEAILSRLRTGGADEAPEALPPGGLSCELRPYQLRGFRWLRQLDQAGLGGVLADDMGLGKTLQALAILWAEKQRPGAGPSLVVAPTSVVPNWEQETLRHAPGLTCLRYVGEERGKLDFSGADLVVTSYALLRRDAERLRAVDWNYVILDEAQAIKNAATQTARAAHRLPARRRLALTGTLLENHLGELWSHFHFLMPGLLGSQREFARRWQRPAAKGDMAALDELRERIRPFILRRMKAEVAPELPPRVDNVLWSEFGPEQEALYRNLLAAGREKVRRAIEQRGFARARPSILEALLRLRQAACHPEVLPDGLGRGVPSAKFDQFCDFVAEVLEEGHRVLVYSQFVQVLTLLRRWFEKERIPHAYLDGRTRDREAKVASFQDDENVKAFLVSLKAGGTGLNLTGADYVILYDPWWNPAVEAQAADRAHRIGQTRAVFTYRMVAKGTVEEKIRRLQEQKRAVSSDLIRSEGEWGVMGGEEELMSLFDE